MANPLIGVTTSAGAVKSVERAYVNAAYLRAVQAAGGVPVLLPPQLGPAGRDDLFARLDGLLLTGGGDIDPARFGEPPHPTLDDVSPARDALELALVRRALEDGVPILAICRGLQVLNVALGGSLHQDIASDPGSPIAHRQQEPREQATHQVKVQAGSRLAGVLGTLAVDVNSLHHQAVDRLGDGLRAVAAAPDGIVEGAEMAGGPPFVLGVQWHPEDLVDRDPAARNLFAALVAAARAARRPG